jgi:methylmalonyl-CoA mutase C-terminal domain/subunit
MDRPIRVLLAKIGLDGHDRGVKVIARALRDAGMEVIYTGLHRRPEEVVRMAVDEDVDAIGVSVLSGAHMTIFPRLLELLAAEGAEGILLVGGGTILPEDMEALEQLGVHKVFGIDTPLAEIVDFLRSAVSGRAGRAA